MGVATTEITGFIESIWNNVLGLDIVVQGSKEPKEKGRLFIAGCVTFAGQWNGVIILDCSMDLAREMAARMFEAKPGELSDDEIRDALGELVNMLAGNVKSILPGSCNLSLPSVTQGTDYQVSVTGGEMICQISYLSGKESFSVILFRGNGSSL